MAGGGMLAPLLLGFLRFFLRLLLPNLLQLLFHEWLLTGGALMAG